LIATDRTWDPICITKNREFGHSTLGFITPCCWLDPVFNNDRLDRSIFTEKLKIANNNEIDDILLSEEWQAFYKTIEAGPEKASAECRRYCYRNVGEHSRAIKNVVKPNGTTEVLVDTDA